MVANICRSFFYPGYGFRVQFFLPNLCKDFAVSYKMMLRTIWNVGHITLCLMFDFLPHQLRKLQIHKIEQRFEFFKWIVTKVFMTDKQDILTSFVLFF